MNTSFNYKKKIRKNKQNKNTLDFIHTQKINDININKKNLDNITNQLNTLKKQYNELDNKKNLSDDLMEKKLNLLDEINIINEKIKYIENNQEENDYFLKCGNILFEYYDNIELDDNDNDNNIKKNIEQNNSNNINLLNFFNKKSSTCTNNKSKKGNLLDEYLNIIDKNYTSPKIQIVDDTLCEKCNSELTIDHIQGISICVSCGEQNNILIDSEKPNYKEPTYESNYFAYKRINHFNEWLSQFQAKESTDIPGEIIEKIMLELKKERIINVANISNNKIRTILKKLKLNKFYEHIPYIINKINGKPPPSISKQIEEKLRYMFKEIQTPFQKHCPKQRKNFLSYSYVIHKFIQLLGIDEYLIYFPLLKSREKLYQQDKIWKNICKELNWKFINSI